MDWILIQTNGIDLHVAMQGSGPFVIFCHGFPGHWSNWKHQLRAVAKAGYTGLAVADKELGNNAREFLTRVYWGLSADGDLGDWSAFPSQGTQYLDVLPAASSLPWPWMSEKDMDVIEAAYLSGGKEKAFYGGLASYRVADINWYIGEKYAEKNVEPPALFISGESDPVMEAAAAEALERMKSRVTDLRGIKIVPKAGHFVQLEKPGETSKVILEFINAVCEENK